MGEIFFCDVCHAPRYRTLDLHPQVENCRTCSRVRAYANLCGGCLERHTAGSLGLPRVPETDENACRRDMALRAARKAKRR